MAEVAPILEVIDLVKHFPVRGGLFGRRQGAVFAVDGLSFSVLPGETLGMVGESGCGKSTAARMIVKLIEPTSGTIHLQGEDITSVSPLATRASVSASANVGDFSNGVRLSMTTPSAPICGVTLKVNASLRTIAGSLFSVVSLAF